MRTIKLLVSLGLASTSLACVAAPDAAVNAILSKNNCLACHAVDRKVVGPSYKDVGAKFKDDPNAVTLLVGKIKNGSAGTWGPVPMPPNPGISSDEAKQVVNWILSGAPG
ncbi:MULTISPECIES: c-type cytochrome [Achromobacter]|uniref:C-type cytochrome n=1 Tax=Achromobacter denitrificans TaxID=32002 RepID=A0ABZ3G491_ACHDE|nr:c-type cytochrome [Achromobacter xylosoxidans]